MLIFCNLARCRALCQYFTIYSFFSILFSIFTEETCRILAPCLNSSMWTLTHYFYTTTHCLILSCPSTKYMPLTFFEQFLAFSELIWPFRLYIVTKLPYRGKFRKIFRRYTVRNESLFLSCCFSYAYALRMTWCVFALLSDVTFSV